MLQSPQHALLMIINPKCQQHFLKKQHQHFGINYRDIRLAHCNTHYENTVYLPNMLTNLIY